MAAPSWRIVFFGTPSFALPTLRSLLEGPDQVVAVVSQPDRPKGRGQRMSPTPVKTLSVDHGLTVLQPEKATDAAFLETLKGLRPDLLVVVAYGQILPESVLVIPTQGAVNVHASLLPKYRGAAPIAWAILNGERMTGATTMMMDAGMDTGDILLQADLPITDSDTGETLHDSLSSLGARLLRETLEGMKKGVIRAKPQDSSEATYAPSIKKEAAAIDWRKKAREIDRQVRAFNPLPGAFTRWEEKLLKIYRGDVREGRPGTKPGSVVWVATDFVEVGTGEGSFLIREVQMQGGKRMGIRDFLSGHAVPMGTTFE